MQLTESAERTRVLQRATGPIVELLTDAGQWTRVHSAHDPSAEASRWLDTSLAATHDGAAPALMFVIGAGAGFLLDEIERRGWVTRVVIVEPEASMARVLIERRDWRHWIADGRLSILVGPQYAGAAAVAQTLANAHRAPVLVHPVVERSLPDGVRAAHDVVSRLRFESAANGEARRAGASRVLLQTLTNAATMAREGDVATLNGLFTGVPAIISAAGPSLDANAPDLWVSQDRALMIACDTATRPLLTRGIPPHLVVGLDPSVANGCHLGGLNEPQRSWLVAEGSLHPRALDQFADRTFFFRVGHRHPWPWLGAHGLDRGTLDVWGSVLTAAFDLALRLGCSPIIFAGADLAFTNNRPYCRGTIFEAQWACWVAGGDTYDNIWKTQVDRWPAVEVADMNGAPARTAAHLVAFRDWLVDRSAAEPAGRVMNATGAGILHGGSITHALASLRLQGSPVLNQDDIQRRLRHAHGARLAPPSLVPAVHALLAGEDAATVRDWTAFAGGTLALDDLRSAVGAGRPTGDR